MATEAAMDLCLALVHAESEREVVSLLSDAGYWSRGECWRFYGDRESNYNTIGNQQSSPDAALVEKIVNSIDARLMHECLVRGIDPEGPQAPKTIREAVALFFEEEPHGRVAGLLREWPDAKRRRVASGITVAATGAQPQQGDMCLTVSDCGEGQTPRMMPLTLLSLDRSNKLRIPFVQGKFNMGGSGALVFCGRNKLQLVLSRRDPRLVRRGTARSRDEQWGFTVVRREDPSGNRLSSVYTFLAPSGAEAEPGKGDVLSFRAEELPLFPDGLGPYARKSGWGTLVKLYEYSLPGHRSHILMKKGLLSRLELLLPEIALPVRLHECRGYSGHPGSFETTMTGLGVRLEDDKAENLEEGVASSCPIKVSGEDLSAKVYAFRRGRSDAYKKNEGILFVMNGQTQGYLTQDFFRRKSVGYSYLADSALVVVDCSRLSGRAREDLFKNSRDRLSGGELRTQIEGALEDLLRNHQGLRDLRERRRREEIQSRYADEKPLAEMLESLLRRSPTLSALFLDGNRVPNPFRTTSAAQEDAEYKGKRYPTYFKFKGMDYGLALERACHANMRCRAAFETDADNDYFTRNDDPGQFSIWSEDGGDRRPVADYVLNLRNGIATLSMRLPIASLTGDRLRYIAQVNDASRVTPFENHITITVKDAISVSAGSGERRRPPAGGPDGGRELPSGIELPKITPVYRTPESGRRTWDQMEPPFDQFSALRVVHVGPSADRGHAGRAKDVYDFFVNCDNVYLQTELKRSQEEAEVVRARFVYGLVLLGLGYLHHHSAHATRARADSFSGRADADTDNIEETVEEFAKAVSCVLLPMIDHLGGLDEAAVAGSDLSGEAT